jgi:hypothetical protein
VVGGLPDQHGIVVIPLAGNLANVQLAPHAHLSHTRIADM